MLLRVSCMEVCYFGSNRVMNNGRTAVIHSVYADRPSIFAPGLTHVIRIRTKLEAPSNRTRITTCFPIIAGRYRKAVRMAPSPKYDAGKLVNLMATDADKIGKSEWVSNTKGYSSTYLAMGFANVRAGTRYPPEH